MIAANVTISQLEKALATLNNKYDDNIIWNREPELTGKRFRFTIKVKDSKGKGAKVSYGYGYKSRRTRACCWHAHGDLFDIILDECPKAVIKAVQHTIYKDSNGNIINNWIDWNIGSQVYPIQFSESCECE